MGVLRESNFGFSCKSELIDCFENSIKWRSLRETNFCFKIWLLLVLKRYAGVTRTEYLSEKKFSLKSGFKHSRWAVGIARTTFPTEHFASNLAFRK